MLPFHKKFCEMTTTAYKPLFFQFWNLCSGDSRFLKKQESQKHIWRQAIMKVRKFLGEYLFCKSYFSHVEPFLSFTTYWIIIICDGEFSGFNFYYPQHFIPSPPGPPPVQCLDQNFGDVISHQIVYELLSLFGE